MTLGNRIAFYRKKLNITQEALARQLGVTNQAVSKWESDQCCPDVMLLPKLAEIFSITMDELFGREPEKTSDLDRVSAFAEESLPDIGNIMHNIISEEIADNMTDEMNHQDPENRKKSGFEKMFGISLAALDKKANQQKNQSWAGLPWEDDNILRVAVYVGRELICGGLAKPGYEFDVKRDVDAVLSSISGISISCGNVGGDVDAGGNVICGRVGGDVDAGSNVTCDAVGGDVDAGSSVTCGDVGGDVDAGTDVKCGDVSGDVDAGCNVECGNVGGDIDAGAVVSVR